MAFTTTEVSVRDTDGWVKVADATTAFLFIRPDTNLPWWMAVGSAAPAFSAASATGTLTNSVSFVADETVTVGSVTYTFKVSPALINEVAIGANVAASLTNLAAAINIGVGPSGIANPDASAAATATTVVLTARTPGTAGNAVATTETGTTSSFGATTLTGGAAAGTGGVRMNNAESDDNTCEAFESPIGIAEKVWVRVGGSSNGGTSQSVRFVTIAG